MTTSVEEFLIGWAILIGFGVFATWGNADGIEGRWWKVLGITFGISCIITAARAIT